MLQQREAFSNAIHHVVKKHLGAESDILNDLLHEGDLRKTLYNLIQCVCGRRAKIIVRRRYLFKPKNDFVASLLDDIPTSETFLFSDEIFGDFFEHYGH